MNEDNVVENVGTAPEAEQGQAAGSPPAEGTLPTSTEGSDQTEAQTSEQPVPASDTGAKELRQKVTQLSETLAGYNDLFAILKNDPALWGQIEKTVKGQETQTDPLAEVYGEVDNLFEADTAKALRPVLEKLGRAIEAKLTSRLSPVLRDAASTAMDAKAAAGLRKAGVDPTVITTEEFNEFVQEFKADESWIKSVLRDDPVSGYKLIGEKWKQKTGNKNGIQAQQARLAAAKAGSTLESRGSQGGATRSGAQKLTLRRGNDSALEIFKAHQSGVPFDAIDLTN